MAVANPRVVSIHYKLTNDAGEVLDSSDGGAPLQYLEGAQNIIPGLENALTGKETGHKDQVSVSPDQGYGEHSPELVQEVPLDAFQGVDKVEPGMQFHAQTEQGPRVIVIKDVGENTATIDANHPLAGQTLNFDVEIVETREATAQEVEHGHAHGPEGHDH